MKAFNKFHTSDKAVRTVDDIVFDSLLEARLYVLLKDAIGLDAFELQPSFTLQEKFRDTDGKLIRPIAYKADFLIPDGNHNIVIDTKGMKTPEFKIKLKILKYQNRGIDIRLLSSQKSFVDLILSLENVKVILPGTKLNGSPDQIQALLRLRCKEIWAATKQKKPEMIKGQ
jgi:hypothetical protein